MASGRSRKHAAKKETAKVALENASPGVIMFQAYQEELDEKHNKHERLVKLSRDCTIISKRTIFLLHRISNETEKMQLLSEAEEKIEKEIRPLLRSIASELVGEDPDKFHAAYTPGLQEFIEALAYLHFLKHETLISIEEVQQLYLTFKSETSQHETSEAEIKMEDYSTEGTVNVASEVTQSGASDSLEFKLDPVDYVLGVADLTGELMRLSISSVGRGDCDTPFHLLPFVRAVHRGFHSLHPFKELSKKMTTLRASLGKIENVCYTITIRGSEVPKHMLAESFKHQDTKED